MSVADDVVDGLSLADALLRQSTERRASDVHLDATPQGYQVRFRIDGLLGPISEYSTAQGRALVSRLMVMAGLLTYRLDLPQEGRLRWRGGGTDSECRLAVIPAAHGLRATLRLPDSVTRTLSLDRLSLPPAALAGLTRFAAADSGLLLLCGPAGAGKTTTIYALLHHLVQTQPDVSVITLEDPIERSVPGVTQIPISPHGGMTYEQALRSVLRQDPQVLMLGEIRDAATASLAIQAALSGHRLICTLHAATCGGAVGRLLEMGLEPYQITSTLFGVLSQRLVRQTSDDGYRGRLPLAEFAVLSPALRRLILANADVDALNAAVRQAPLHLTLRQSGENLIQQGLTDPAELLRVLGPATEDNA